MMMMMKKTTFIHEARLNLKRSEKNTHTHTWTAQAISLKHTTGRMIEPSCNSSLLSNTVAHHSYAHTGAPHIHTHAQPHTDASVHTHVGSNNGRNIHTIIAPYTLMIHIRLLCFFPYSIAWCSYRFKPRFLLLFPPPSYIHSGTLSISFARSLHVCKCACLFFVRSSILSLFTRSELVCEIRMCALLLHRFWVHRLSLYFFFFFPTSSSAATKISVLKPTVPKLISKNRK